MPQSSMRMSGNEMAGGDMSKSDRPGGQSLLAENQKKESDMMRATPRHGGFEADTAKTFQMQATKQGVIEYKVNKPFAEMPISDGVSLVERGKAVRAGQDYSAPGKLKLNEYRKLNDPRQQQVSDTMSKRNSEM